MNNRTRPGSRKAQRKVKASSLKYIREKGCEPRKALPGMKKTALKDEIKAFVEQVPINGNTPIGPRAWSWQDIGMNYLIGLILPGKRKSMEPISKRIPDEDYQKIQQFITDSPWNPKETMHCMMTFLRDNIATSEGVIIIDDTGSKKQGDLSPGVARQFFSETRKIANCQRIVTGVYSEPIGPLNADVVIWPLDMRLMLPKVWDKDRQRRKKAGMPSDVRHKKNWKIGLELIEDIIRLKIPHKCIMADTDYGRVRDFRSQLREWNEPYIMSVRLDKLNVIPEDAPIIRPDDVVGKRGRTRRRNYLPKGVRISNPGKIAKRIKDWTKVRWGEGAKGPLEADFFRMRVRTVRWKFPLDEVGWLLMEKGSEGVKAYICWGLDELSLEELVKLAHSRWAIETYHEYIKNELGFDHFEGRKYRGWLHHSVLTQMAFAVLEWIRWRHRDSNEEVSLPTLQDVQQMLVDMIIEMLLPDEGNCKHCRTCPIVTMLREAG